MYFLIKIAFKRMNYEEVKRLKHKLFCSIIDTEKNKIIP